MNTEQTGDLGHRAAVHAALGDVTRLRIVDLLATSDRSSHEIGATLAIPSNLLAHHLGVLEDAELLHRHRSEGDRRRTYVALDHDTLAAVAVSPGSGLLRPSGRVVFVCTANTARSHLAAALWREATPLATASAGTHPGERIHPGVLAAAGRHCLDLPDIAPRSLTDLTTDDDLLITVCDRAYEEVGTAAWAHWSVPDPVPDGTESAFETAHEDLSRRVAALAEEFVHPV